jgi:hypothetical protein
MRSRILIVVAIAFCFVVAYAFSPAQGHKKFQMVVAYVQSGAPVQLTSITHGNDFLYQKAEVKNVSDRTVESVTFGVLLHETPPNQSEPIVAVSQQVPTDIKPGQIRSVDVLALHPNQAQERASQLKSNTVIAEFGVLGVQFEDGSSWTFDSDKNRTLSSSPIAMSTGRGNCKPSFTGSGFPRQGHASPCFGIC